MPNVTFVSTNLRWPGFRIGATMVSLSLLSVRFGSVSYAWVDVAQVKLNYYRQNLVTEKWKSSATIRQPFNGIRWLLPINSELKITVIFGLADRKSARARARVPQS